MRRLAIGIALGVVACGQVDPGADHDAGRVEDAGALEESAPPSDAGGDDGGFWVADSGAPPEIYECVPPQTLERPDGGGCEWAIEPPPDDGCYYDTLADRSLVRASVLDDEEDWWPSSDGAACSDGSFYFDREVSPTRITLCPSACERYRASPSLALQLVFGCPSMVRPCE